MDNNNYRSHKRRSDSRNDNNSANNNDGGRSFNSYSPERKRGSSRRHGGRSVSRERRHARHSPQSERDRKTRKDNSDYDKYADSKHESRTSRRYHSERHRNTERQRSRSSERAKKDRSSRGEKRRSHDRDTERERYYERGRDREHAADNERNSQDLAEESDESSNSHYYNKEPSNTVIVMGLQSHVTEADIMSTLIRMNIACSTIRLIRKKNTGASRGFAFVEFNTTAEAQNWMEITQGILTLTDNTRAALEYSHRRESVNTRSKSGLTDWFCGKCGVFNFKRRGNCFKCLASREESETGGEGSDEISNILTKKIMLRNLDALTNEEAVLTAIQKCIPDLAAKINKILISRDALTQTSRGICYLSFESLIDSMNVHNSLSTLETPLNIDNRDVMVSYCIDHENKIIVPKHQHHHHHHATGDDGKLSNDNVTAGSMARPLTASEIASAALTMSSGSNTDHMKDMSVTLGVENYTLEDVPRLAEYSASVYATTPEEHIQYMKYYTDYYIKQIKQDTYKESLGVVSANSGAAVALTAIQRKQKKMNSIETTASASVSAFANSMANKQMQLSAQEVINIPTGTDGKIYATPDMSRYHYDDTSGYYYDPLTGLYYDAQSQYYYNSKNGQYLYWDAKNYTYILAQTPAADTEGETKKLEESQESSEVKTKKKDDSHGGVIKPDKVKVAKKIVKDMEKWAKQLNQKKDFSLISTTQSISLANAEERATGALSVNTDSAYADVGFTIMEKKESQKLIEHTSPIALRLNLKKPELSHYSDSDEDNLPKSAGSSSDDFIDLQRLTCLLCKRAFQSVEILQKHCKMSNLHQENLQKHKMQLQGGSALDQDSNATLNSLYRDRAKERRKKYGEHDIPPPNRSRERFEKEMKSLTAKQGSASAPVLPLDNNNVGSRLLQKMGWSEGQGLGRQNQGRTSIIEANTRNSTAGLGAKSGGAAGDDYKTYVKKMMKSRYESV